MTTVILTRKNWEKDSAKGVAQFLEDTSVLQTGDSFPEDVNLVFRWGCTANVPTNKVVNRATHIHRVANKSGFRKVLQSEKLCPETYFDLNTLVDNIVDGSVVHGDWVVRPNNHSRGSDMLLCNTAAQLRAGVEQLGVNSYISRKINKKHEYRAIFVQGRVVQVVEKFPSDPTRLNWGLGTFKNVRWSQWPMNVVEVAAKAHKLSELTFSAVDVITDEDNIPYVLEVNTAPELVGEYSQGCVGKAFKNILDNGKDDVPITGNEWQNYIHPSLTDMAA